MTRRKRGRPGIRACLHPVKLVRLEPLVQKRVPEVKMMHLELRQIYFDCIHTHGHD